MEGQGHKNTALLAPNLSVTIKYFLISTAVVSNVQDKVLMYLTDTDIFLHYEWLAEKNPLFTGWKINCSWERLFTPN